MHILVNKSISHAADAALTFSDLRKGVLAGAARIMGVPCDLVLTLGTDGPVID